MDTEATESSSCSKNCTEDASSLFNCKICWQLAEDPVVTQCGHLFCWFCLCSWLESFSKCKECPVCRAIIEEDKLVPLYGTESERKEAKDLDPNSEKSIPNRPIAPRPQTATLPNNEDYFPEDEDDFSEDDEDLNSTSFIFVKNKSYANTEVYPAISTSCNPPLYYQIRPPRWIETPFLPLGAMVVQDLRKKKGFWDPAMVPEIRILGQRFCEDRQPLKERFQDPKEFDEGSCISFDIENNQAYEVPKEDLAIANTQNKRKNRFRVEDAARLVMLMKDVHRSRIEEAARLFMLMEDAHRSRVEEAARLVMLMKDVQRATLCLHEGMGQLREDMQRLQEDVQRDASRLREDMDRLRENMQRDMGRLRGNVSRGL
nr:e3 ubiquitin-protein ligase rnf5 [Quercus suber]